VTGRTGPGASSFDLGALLDAAERFAVAAGELTLLHFGALLAAESKSDGSPVTVADREAERYLRSQIRAAFPTHAILGEEFGEERGSDPIRWILDPIDGTRGFMRGVPLYGVLIGIEVEGEAAVGVAHFPPLGETVAAASGLGCRWRVRGAEESRPARVSEISTLSDATVLVTDPRISLSTSLGEGWRKLAAEVDLARGWGDAYGHLLIATGRAEVMVDPILAPWDAAPFLPILREAGGRFTDFSGVETIHGGRGVSSNGRLHADVLARLNPAG
jgi:histidinol phosphatase-like enzyme (inositol monophosphatase family)